MDLGLQILIVGLCGIFVGYVLKMVARERLLLRYSLLWLALAVIVLVVAIFPGVVVALGGFFGFEIASNFIFFIGLFLLMVIVLSLSMVASKSTVRIVNLIQQQALLEKELEELSKRFDNSIK